MPRRGPRSRPSKYQPIADFLAAQDLVSVRLTLAEIETLLGFPLPVYAHVNSVWWRYPAPWVRALTAAGWQARLQIRERVVVFTRIPEREE